MNPIESIVTQIQGISSTSPDISALHNYLKQVDDSLHTESTRLLPFIDQLDPSLHSLGYLYFLEACTSGPVSEEQAETLAFILARFITSCVADQIRLVPDKIHLCLEEVQRRGYAPWCTFMRHSSYAGSSKKDQSTSAHLTPLHPEFLQLCLLLKSYKVGISILGDDIFEVDQPRDLFLYSYYGGMICIGQECFQKALELLHNVVTAPMPVMNAIAVEAYKKYILVSLIHQGQFLASLREYTSTASQRNLKNLCQPYIELANSYSTGKFEELESTVQANREKFESDGNIGLVKQDVSSMYKRNIQRLTQTYLTLSLQDIANTVQLSSPKGVEMHVLQMIQDICNDQPKRWHGSISRRS